jgi:hypothetical protein
LREKGHLIEEERFRSRVAKESRKRYNLSLLD